MNPSLGSVAFIGFCCAVVWLICAPFQLIARLQGLRQSGDQNACRSDCDAGVEQTIHGGANK